MATSSDRRADSAQGLRGVAVLTHLPVGFPRGAGDARAWPVAAGRAGPAHSDMRRIAGTSLALFTMVLALFAAPAG